MLRRITDPTMNHLWNWNTIKAIMYGNKIVFDCSYEKYMNPMEIKSTAKQIMESYACNRVHNYPFEILLCNIDMQGELIDRLNRFLPNIFDDDFPMTISSKSYLEHFEKSKLVYLTANSNVELVEYDHNSIYIIGAYVDKVKLRWIQKSIKAVLCVNYYKLICIFYYLNLVFNLKSVQRFSFSHSLEITNIFFKT